MAIETTTKYICDNCNEEIEISYGMPRYHPMIIYTNIEGRSNTQCLVRISKPKDLLFCNNKCLKEYMDKLNVL